MEKQFGKGFFEIEIKLLKDVPSCKIDKSNNLRIDILKSKDIESIRASKNIGMKMTLSDASSGVFRVSSIFQIPDRNGLYTIYYDYVDGG